MTRGLLIVAIGIAALWILEWVCSAGESFTRGLGHELIRHLTRGWDQ